MLIHEEVLEPAVGGLVPDAVAKTQLAHSGRRALGLGDSEQILRMGIRN
jgi:hypothetical protein